jgi:putative flippase GtrA
VRPTSRLGRAARAPQLGYLLAGGSSFLLDFLTLYLLHGVAEIDLAVATTIAYLVGLVVNFAANRYLVFSRAQPLGRAAFRYGLLVALNYAATLVIVTTLPQVGISYLLAKVLAVAATLVWNFVAYQRWVFAGTS